MTQRQNSIEFLINPQVKKLKRDFYTFSEKVMQVFTNYPINFGNLFKTPT